MIDTLRSVDVTKPEISTLWGKERFEECIINYSSSHKTFAYNNVLTHSMISHLEKL